MVVRNSFKLGGMFIFRRDEMVVICGISLVLKQLI